jgi:hypothetical protein
MHLKFSRQLIASQCRVNPAQVCREAPAEVNRLMLVPNMVRREVPVEASRLEPERNMLQRRTSNLMMLQPLAND